MIAPKILVIDDEPSILDLVTAYLTPEGYEVRTATDGLTGLELARTYKPNLVVLDIMLPGIDGLEMLARLRRDSDAYVILLTAKTEETDKIIGLAVGADDYVTKPFSPRELVARVKAALRRLRSETGTSTGMSVEDSLVFECLRIDLAARRVWAREQEVELTTTEFDLLSALAENAGRVLSREQLLEKVWGYDYFGDDRVVDVHIGHIRQKLGEDYISTIRGVGYRFESRGE